VLISSDGFAIGIVNALPTKSGCWARRIDALVSKLQSRQQLSLALVIFIAFFPDFPVVYDPNRPVSSYRMLRVVDAQFVFLTTFREKSARQLSRQRLPRSTS
jgi:hypothetical protein